MRVWILTGVILLRFSGATLRAEDSAPPTSRQSCLSSAARFQGCLGNLSSFRVLGADTLIEERLYRAGGGMGRLETYEQQSGTVTWSVTLRGKGLLQAFQKRLDFQDSGVPGKDYDGRSSLSLERGEFGTVSVRLELHFDDVLGSGLSDEKPVDLKIDYVAEAEFVEGSWQDMESGRQVKIQYTEAGQSRASGAIYAGLHGLVERDGERLKAEFSSAGVVVQDVSILGVESRGRTVLQGDLRQLAFSGPPTEFSINIDVQVQP